MDIEVKINNASTFNSHNNESQRSTLLKTDSISFHKSLKRTSNSNLIKIKFVISLYRNFNQTFTVTKCNPN